MKTVKSVDELRLLALRTGAELVLGDERFNTLRAVVTPRPPPPKPAPSPPPAPHPLPEFVSREQVERLLAEQEERMFQRIDQLLAGLEWVHQVTYDSDGGVTAVRSIRK